MYGELATTQCYNACRQLLRDRNGYEWGVEEGTFLAAFSTGTDALQFCVVVRMHSFRAQLAQARDVVVCLCECVQDYKQALAS